MEFSLPLPREGGAHLAFFSSSGWNLKPAPVQSKLPDPQSPTDAVLQQHSAFPSQALKAGLCFNVLPPFSPVRGAAGPPTGLWQPPVPVPLASSPQERHADVGTFWMITSQSELCVLEAPQTCASSWLCLDYFCSSLLGEPSRSRGRMGRRRAPVRAPLTSTLSWISKWNLLLWKPARKKQMKLQLLLKLLQTDFFSLFHCKRKHLF